MKKITVLLVTFIVFICVFTSCVVVNKKINIDGKSANLIVDELDDNYNYNIIFDENSYVYSGDYNEFFFYNVHTEPAAYFWGHYGLTCINVGQIEQFGTVFTLSHPIWDAILGGNTSVTRCYFSEKVVMPEKETLIIDDIVVTMPSGFIQNHMFYEFYCEKDLKSHYASKVIDKSLWNEENKEISWGEILDFENTVVLDPNLNIPMGEYVTFTFKDHKAFIGGIFHLVSIDGEWYLYLWEVSTDKIAYRINSEYQSVFDIYYE